VGDAVGALVGDAVVGEDVGAWVGGAVAEQWTTTTASRSNTTHAHSFKPETDTGDDNSLERRLCYNIDV
jgi:hypothetical protein